ncbi:hypothetical protein FJT64_007125 [Amphibalanus amphitrite]|uniref:Uncharacterized protein n=1 Tax=Amphibalanus amphitrite TaxID=1232801 RepID=A0A6A4VLB9_AMPAM|nr:hypothetical protein FJT64_007125 [Amphibalanus amphitrite]
MIESLVGTGVTRLRVMPGTDDGEERRSPSPGHSEGGDGVAPQREKYRPRSRTGFARSHSVTTYVFDEDEYTKIQTPRQDMIFKKSAFTRRRPAADGSLSEEAETMSVGAGSEPAPPSERAACPPAEQTSSGTPELSEVSSEGKAASECGEGSEPRDPLAALASQIQYAFIDPQGNVYFNGSYFLVFKIGI